MKVDMYVIRMTIIGNHFFVVGFTELMHPTWSEYVADASWYDKEEAERISEMIYNGSPLEIVTTDELYGEKDEA